MEQKEQIKFGGSVSETLLINLYMRHLDSLKKQPVLGDPHSSDVVAKIDYDFAKFDESHMTKVGACVRARYIDEAILEYAKGRENLIIVQIGAGLDTRPLRLSERIAGAIFYDLDLPSVMELRDKLIPKNGRMFSMRASMFDDEWIKELKERHAGATFIFVFEGVVMYFDSSVIRDFFAKLAENFDGIIMCDIIHESAMKIFKQERHDSLKHVSGKLKFYGASAEGLASEHVHLTKCENMMELYKTHWSLKARLLMLFPIIRNMSKICVYEIGK
ncbi:MAG: class I SAM-dependent methyltransferase [Wolinella sp.]